MKEEASDFLNVPPLPDVVVSPNAVDTTEILDCLMSAGAHDDILAAD